jgi:N-acetylneuraminic acid mutarotase
LATVKRWLVLLAACGGDDAMVVPDTPVQTCAPTTPWASAPDLPLGATQETAVVATGGKIYVLGGFNASTTVIAAVQVFDTQACTWSMGPALPKPIHHANAAVLDGTIYVLGALETISFTAIGDVWAWNPATETTWSSRTAMPAGTERGAAVTAALDGKIYVAGGFRAGGSVGDVSVFDPATGWSALPALPDARDHACGGAANGKLYVLGGRKGGSPPVPNAFEYAPGGAWTERAMMPTGRGGTACGVVGNRIVVTGGEGNGAASSGVFPQVEAYDASADRWDTLAPMPTPRHGTGGAVVDGRMYVPGGASRQGFGAVATHEVLTP